MNKVITLLEKELERQELLMATNEQMKEEINKHPLSSWPRGPMPEEVYPDMEELRDGIKEAIKILKGLL